MTDPSPRLEGGAPAAGDGAGAPLVLPGRFRAVVFDMDGLLIDSEPLWVEAESELLARHGQQFTEEDIRETHGRSIAASIHVYARRLGDVDPIALERELLELMLVHYTAGPPLRPGAVGLVERLHGRVPLAVASNTSSSLVKVALAKVGLLDRFDAVLSAADLGRSKPDPAVYVAACEALRVAPADAVAFEDSPAGVESAVAAGLTVIGVPERPDVDLVGAGASRIVESLDDVVVER